MIEIRCNRCNSIIYPDRFGLLSLTCDNCLTNSERRLRKEREKRIIERIKVYEEIHNC